MLPVDAKILDAAAVGAILRRATTPEFIGFWPCPDRADTGMVIHFYGYKTGKAGTENKHEVLPPYDTSPLFGEAVVFAMKDGALVSFSTTDYTKFYNDTLRERDASNERDENSDGNESGEENAGGEEDAVEDDEDDASSESDDSSDADSVKDPVCADEDEDDLVSVPAPILPLIALKPKRVSKKALSLYAIPEIVHVNYGADNDAGMRTPLRRMAMHVLKQRCENHIGAEEIDDFERGIFNAALQEGKRRLIRCVWENSEFQTVYEITAKRVISNVDAQSYVGNTRLFTRLREGEFVPHDIPFMSYSDLYPEKWRTLSEAAMKREAKMLEVDKSMATDMFRCTRCGKRQCTYYEMQTRSADEPMTQFVRCLNCAKQWRQ